MPVTDDKFWFLFEKRAVPLPSPFNNQGNYVLRWINQSMLGVLCGIVSDPEAVIELKLDNIQIKHTMIGC